MFILIAVIMLLSATWLGLSFANRLVAPIRRLIAASDQVSSRQSPCAGRGAQVGRRSCSPWRNLQQNDLGAAPSAKPADCGEQSHRRAAFIHRGGSLWRSGGCRRRRTQRRNHSAQSLSGTADTASRPGRGRPASSAKRSTPCCRKSRDCSRKRARVRPACIRVKSRYRAAASSVCSTSASPARRRVAPTRAISSPSMTSPISSRRSGRPLGPTSPGASRMKSEIH